MTSEAVALNIHTLDDQIRIASRKQQNDLEAWKKYQGEWPSHLSIHYRVI